MLKAVIKKAAEIHRQNPFKAGLVLRVLDSFAMESLNNVVYPWILIRCSAELGAGRGLLVGSGILLVFAAVINLAYLFAYNKFRYDIFGLEAEKGIIRRIKGTDLPELASRSKLWALWAMLLLPVITDPFLTIARLRPRDSYKMEAADWVLFSTSVVVGSVLWSLFLSLVILISGRFHLSSQDTLIVVIGVAFLVTILCMPGRKSGKDKTSGGPDER